MSMSFLFFFSESFGKREQTEKSAGRIVIRFSTQGTKCKKKDLKNKISLGRNPLKGGRVHTSTRPSSV